MTTAPYCGYWISANGALRATYTKPSAMQRLLAWVCEDKTWRSL